MSLKEQLSRMVTQGAYNSLPELLKIAGIKPVSRKKDDMVNALYEVLSKEENIYYIWEALPNYDKEIIEEFIRTEGHPDSQELETLAKKHNKTINSYGFLSDVNYIPKNSKANLFVMNYKIPEEIRNVLKKYIKDLEIKYKPVEPKVQEEYDKILCIGESFEQDFTNVIKLISTQKLKAVKSSGLPNKQGAVKIESAILNKEILPYGASSMDYARVVEDTIRIYGISSLLKQANIISTEKDVLILGDKAKEFLSESMVHKCHRLLAAYTDSAINELGRLKTLKVTGNDYFGLKQCRKLILEFISKSPINQWIDIEQVKYFIKKTNNRFLEKAVGSICSYCEYEYEYEYRYQRNHGWDDIEGRLIEVVMQEYLSTIGIVDIIYSFEESDYGQEYITVTHYRLTPLGAYVLGVNNNYNYETPKEKSGLIINNDSTISITEGLEKQLHEIFMDSVSEKLIENEETKYAITFKSIAKAIDEGISVREVIDYLIDNSLQEIPEKVLSTLIRWEELSKKIKIRQITIMEIDSAELYEELKNNKAIRNKMNKEITNAFELDAKNITSVKRQLEKKNYFCVLENGK